MDKDVYVGIDVSKTELVVAVRPAAKASGWPTIGRGSSSWWVGWANCSPS